MSMKFFHSGLRNEIKKFRLKIYVSGLSLMLNQNVNDLKPHRFGETDLPIDDIAAVCLLVNRYSFTFLSRAQGVLVWNFQFSKYIYLPKNVVRTRLV